MFVDDQVILADLTCSILQSHGYLTKCAYSGIDALELFTNNKTIDILVTDFRMVGMNGLELARLVRKITPGVPVIIVSGYGPVDGSEEVDEWLQKEGLFPALLNKIQQLIGDSNSAKIVHSA